MIDLRQTPEYASYLKAINWQVEKIDNNYYFLKKFLFWYILKIQRVSILRDSDIKILTKKYRIFKIYLEPFKKPDGFKQSKSFYLPTKTIQVNLENSLEKLVSELHQKTRYNIKLALKKKYKIINSQDIDLFAKLWSQNREGFFGRFISQKNNINQIYKAFEKKSQLLIAFNLNKPIAGVLILESDTTAYYMYAFSNDEGRRLFAPTLLTWTAIENAKKKALKIFDFDGIYDERFPLKAWQGFTKFKKGFGGKVVEYPGCYEKKI